MKISKKQTKVLNVISAYIAKHNYPPTTREISQIVGHKSTSTTHGYLERLRKSGYVDWEEAKPRTLRILRGVS